jgi:hypothetical protein
LFTPENSDRHLPPAPAIVIVTISIKLKIKLTPQSLPDTISIHVTIFVTSNINSFRHVRALKLCQARIRNGKLY